MINEMNMEVEDLIDRKANDFEISKVFKTYIKRYIDSIDTTVDNKSGKDLFVKHTKQTDKFLISLYKYILRKHFGSYQPMSTTIPITLIALGSYGREQLCIYSDVDLMILYEDIRGYNLKDIMEEFITLAWDCGLKLGSRVHELKEVHEGVKEDITIKTSIIESRLIYGSKYLWFAYENVLTKIRRTDQLLFVKEKMQEHKERLAKYPLKMQPNIKDGYGGMREANMLFWMANVIYGAKNLRNLTDVEFSETEYRRYRISLEYIFQVRNHLHNIAKKKLDVVNFDVLPELSSRLGFKHTTRHTKERQAMAKILESLHKIHFFTNAMVAKFTRVVLVDIKNYKELKQVRYKKNLYLLDNKIFTTFKIKPKNLVNLLKELVELPKEVQRFDRSYTYYVNQTILPSWQGKQHKALIKKLLYKENLYPLIKLLYNARIFKAIFPITKKIIDQPQFDGYHQLPVDIHSIRTLKFLENITDPYVKELYENLGPNDRAITRISTLFHDVGKGRTADHHEVGELLFKGMSKGLDLDSAHSLTISKLIRYHNLMSKVATNEDIYSEKVILNFIGLIKDQRFLKMLYILTYADISAVGENVYNSSTSSLLKQLYLQAIPAFENRTLVTEGSRRIAKINAIKNLKAYKELASIMKKKISYIASNQIFLQIKATDILELAIRANKVKDYTYKIINEEVLTIQIIRAVPLNLGYMLGKLEFLNIASTNIFKLFDEKKCFEIKFEEKIDEADLLFVQEIIANSFDMTKSVKLHEPTIKKEEIEIDTNHTSSLASFKIKTKNQKGLVAYVSKVFDDFGIEIESAKIYTSRGKVRDLFLIEKNGNFIVNADKITNLLCAKTIS